MADPVVKKRPVILRLAELQNYPTLEDRYAATLPFKGGAANCGCLWDSSEFMNCCGITPSSVRAKCIKRTAERWAVSILSKPYSSAFFPQTQCHQCKKKRLTVSMNIVVLLSAKIGRYFRQTPRHSQLSPLGDPSDDHGTAI